MLALQEFYDALHPKIKEIAAELDNCSLNSLNQPQADLMALALMFMEVAPAIEYYNNPDVPNAVDYNRFEIYATAVGYRVTG
ncbi:MAG: hypothetical protein AAF387_22105 [Pseudomonadota bacterium]